MAKAAAVAKRHWWLLLLRGLVGVLFGIAAITHPGITLVALGVYFGLFLLLSGLVDVVASVVSRSDDDMWWLKLMVGAIELGFGVYLFQRPGLSIATFVVFVALFLIIRGVVDLVVAFDKTLATAEKMILAVAGSAGLLAGIIIWRYPVEGSLAFVWLLGLYALLTGPMWIVLAYEAKESR